MSFVEGFDANCGVSELGGIRTSSPEQTIRMVCLHFAVNEAHNRAGMRLWGDCGCSDCLGISLEPFLVYTDYVRNGESTGHDLTNYIRKHKLGTVTTRPPRRNPNSGNRIQVWIWSVNWPAMRRHYATISRSRDGV